MIMVAGKRNARAVAARFLSGADRVTRSAMGIIGQCIKAGATAAGFTSSAGDRAIAAVLLVGTEVPAPAAALVKPVLAHALLVIALGVVAAVSVPVAVLTNFLARRQSVLPASDQHRDDAGNDGTSWPRFGQCPRKGIESLFVHVSVLRATAMSGAVNETQRPRHWNKWNTPQSDDQVLPPHAFVT
jgi:hypothetical protein